MKVTLTTEPLASDIEEIRNGLREHNRPHLEEISHTDLACFTYKSNGGKSGGLSGEIWGSWLIVKYLWVDVDEKGQGLGGKLLAEAEKYAMEQGCHSSFLDTFSFQAKPFYEKQGYKVDMTLKNYPVSSKRYYLTKQLVAREE